MQMLVTDSVFFNDQWVHEETKKWNFKFLEADENESTAHQNFWNTTKAVPRGKCIDTNVSIEKSQWYTSRSYKS